VRVDIDGSGAGNDSSWASTQLRGETQKGLQLCGQWPTVWVTSYRGLRGLECVLKKMHSCATHRHRIGRRGVRKNSSWPLALSLWLLCFRLQSSIPIQNSGPASKTQRWLASLRKHFLRIKFPRHSGLHTWPRSRSAFLSQGLKPNHFECLRHG
jgi:hypothetical protein